MPKWSDSTGGGNWKAQAYYSGPKKGNKLTLGLSFYSIGGSISFTGGGVSGSGNSPGGKLVVRNYSTANASGRVYGHGMAIYVGMYSTASFVYGNSYYSTTCKI